MATTTPRNRRRVSPSAPAARSLLTPQLVSVDSTSALVIALRDPSTGALVSSSSIARLELSTISLGPGGPHPTSYSFLGAAPEDTLKLTWPGTPFTETWLVIWFDPLGLSRGPNGEQLLQGVWDTGLL